MMRKLALSISTVCLLFSQGAVAQEATCEKTHFLNKQPYINPAILQDLTGLSSDTGVQIVSVNVTDAQDSNRYFQSQVDITDQGVVVYQTEQGGRFGYKWIGTVWPGLELVQVYDNSGGGSAIFNQALFVELGCDDGLKSEGTTLSFDGSRYVIKNKGQFSLGESWTGTLEAAEGKIFVNGNELTVQKP